MLVSMRTSGSGSDRYLGSDWKFGSDPFPLTSTRIKAGNQSIVPWQAYIRERGASNVSNERIMMDGMSGTHSTGTFDSLFFSSLSSLPLSSMSDSS